MKTLKLAFGLCLVLVPLSNACSTKTHEFTENGGGTAASAGSGATTAGDRASGGTASHAGSSTVPTDAGAGGELQPVAECNEGQQKDCWELEDGKPIEPAFTVEKGSCHIGKRFCGADQRWGACLGAVGPRDADSCDVAGNDDDCDGIPNEGCTCVDGAKRACGSNVGSCKQGQQTCVDHAWGACEGEVTQQALDSCATADNDDNCNGTPNEGCPCVGNATGSCSGGCGTHTCNPSSRAWGSCTLAPSECTSGTQVRDCTDQGWTTTNCKFACSEGQCTGSCTPGATRCATNPERRQSCNDKGVYVTVATCTGNELCQDNGASCIAPCAGKKLCPGNVCAPLGGCCGDADCGGNFACVNGTCSTDLCQQGFNGPCGGVCTKGCCSVNDCPDHPNMGRSCNGSHQCLYGCKQNYGNCDGNDANGCEVNLISGTANGTTVKNCGTCGSLCDFHPPQDDFCTPLANSCAYGECYASFTHPGDTTDEFAYKCPVERPHAVLRRGDCDIGCSYDCSPGYQDCNNYAADGCEVQSNADMPNCYHDAFWGGEPP